MNTIKKISALLALAVVAHEGSATLTFMADTGINTLATTNTAGADTLLTGAGTEFSTAFPASTAQHQTLAVLTPLNVTQGAITSNFSPTTATMAGDIGHFTLGNDVAGSASAINMGPSFSNSMTTNANTTVDQDSGAHTTTLNDGSTAP